MLASGENISKKIWENLSKYLGKLLQYFKDTLRKLKKKNSKFLENYCTTI